MDRLGPGGPRPHNGDSLGELTFQKGGFIRISVHCIQGCARNTTHCIAPSTNRCCVHDGVLAVTDDSANETRSLGWMGGGIRVPQPPENPSD
jgi:hypothetical protein